MTVTNYSKTTRNLIIKLTIPSSKPEQGVYEISCLECIVKIYMRESSHSFNKRIYKHTRDLKRGNMNEY